MARHPRTTSLFPPAIGRRAAVHWRLVGLAILFAACDGEMEPRVPSVLEVWLGDQQTERVNSAVPVAPAVRVLDQKGDALGGAQVIFTVSEGGGSIEAASALSDAQGIARRFFSGDRS